MREKIKYQLHHNHFKTYEFYKHGPFDIIFLLSSRELPFEGSKFNMISILLKEIQVVVK